MLWQEVWKILVGVCGARGDGYALIAANGDFREWRFCGDLGFGGKLWFVDGKLYVNCYQEDETPERLKKIEKANLLLYELQRGAEEERADPITRDWDTPEEDEAWKDLGKD